VYEDMRVKYLCLNMRYAAYIKLEVVLFLAWTIAAALFFFFGRTSQIWIVRNGWWICLCVIVVGTLEAVAAVSKAKKEYRRNQP
jgi:hypothetical protein